MDRCWIIHPCLVVYIYLFILIPKFYGYEEESFEVKQKLVQKLTKDPSTRRQILPVRFKSGPLNLTIDIAIQSIAKVDEINQAIRVIVWLRLYWNNPFLTWKPDDYQNFSSLSLEKAFLWTPDISLINKASSGNEVDMLFNRMSTPVIVSHDGNCAWKAPVTLPAQCKIDVSNFPFDEQNCNISIGPWTGTLLEIDVHARYDKASLESFVPNGEWNLKEARLTRHQATYSGIAYSDVTLILSIERRPLYFGVNLIIPCALVTVLAFLSFALPVNHGERVSLVMTVLVAMSVYMMIVSSILPQTSDGMPIIGVYFICIIVEVALGLVATCFVSRIAEKDTDMPKWFDTLVNRKLACLLMKATVSDDELVASAATNYGNDLSDGNLHEINSGMQLPENDTTSRTPDYHQDSMDKIISKLSVFTDHLAVRRKREERLKKWQNAAGVLDRLFSVTFTTIFVILTSVMLV